MIFVASNPQSANTSYRFRVFTPTSYIQAGPDQERVELIRPGCYALHGLGRRRLRDEPARPASRWEQLVLLCGWPEQVRCEEIRQLLFGGSVAERASETKTSERPLYRRTDRFEAEGMESLFDGEKAKRGALPSRIRRHDRGDLKVKHPSMALVHQTRGEADYPPLPLVDLC